MAVQGRSTFAQKLDCSFVALNNKVYFIRRTETERAGEDTIVMNRRNKIAVRELEMEPWAWTQLKPRKRRQLTHHLQSPDRSSMKVDNDPISDGIAHRDHRTVD